MNMKNEREHEYKRECEREHEHEREREVYGHSRLPYVLDPFSVQQKTLVIISTSLIMIMSCC